MSVMQSQVAVITYLFLMNMHSMLYKPNNLSTDSISTKSLSFFYANIVNKLQSIVYSKSFDIIGLTETWLSLTMKIYPPIGGGVLIIVNDNFFFSKVALTSKL